MYRFMLLFFPVYFVFPVLPPAFVAFRDIDQDLDEWMNENSQHHHHHLILWVRNPFYDKFVHAEKETQNSITPSTKHTYIHIRTNLISKFYVKYCLTPSKPIRFDCYEMLLPLAIVAPSHVACVFTLARC